MNIFDFSIHNTIRKVCVSEAIVPDANGIYTCAGVHGGRPAYRLQRESAVFWICCDGYKWCLVRQQDHPGKDALYSTQFCNEQAGLAQGKLPTGRWCGPKGKVFCKIALLTAVLVELYHFIIIMIVERLHIIMWSSLPARHLQGFLCSFEANHAN